MAVLDSGHTLNSKDIPYLPLMDQLWSVFGEYFGEKWSFYKEI